MKTFLSPFIYCVTLVILAHWPLSTLATNGYWSLGYGIKSKSMAGACTAVPLEIMCTANNPAITALIPAQMEMGLTLFSPTRGFTANHDAAPTFPPASIPPGEYESNNDHFFIPYFGYNSHLDKDSTISITLGGNGGMNTEYDSAVFSNFANPLYPPTLPSTPTGINLMQVFLGISYARKITPQQTVGMTPIFALQAFEAQGLQPFTPFSLYPNEVTNKGRDTSYGGGIRMGWLGQLSEQLSLGASYQSKLWMSHFDKYKGLLADAGNFDIPANYSLGLAYKITPQILFAFDYQRIEFSSIKAIGNASDLVFMPGQLLLGTEEGLGFGWKDMKIYKFGIQWDYRSDLTIRAGFSKASEAFPNTQALFNVLAPATVREHYTVGFTEKLANNQEIDFFLMYVPQKSVYGTNVNTGPQTGKLQMKQWEIGLGWNKQF